MIISSKALLILSVLTMLYIPKTAVSERLGVKGVDYDSAADWTEDGTQPNGVWTYGSYSAAGQWQSYAPLTGFTVLDASIGGVGTRWGTEPSIAQFSQLPASAVWAVRRWTSPLSGQVEIDYDVARLDDEAGDNGQITGIYLNGSQLWSQDLGSAADGGHYSGTLTTTVNEGDVVDFIVDSKGNNLADWTHFWSRIRTKQLRPGTASGLATHWTLDETSAFPSGFGQSRVERAADWSGNQEPALLQYMDSEDWISGRIGGMLGFDGGNDHLISANGNLTDGATALTLSAWISPDSQGGWRGILTTKDPQYFGFNSTGYRVNAIEFRANNTRVQTLDNAIPFTSWTLVTCVWKSGQIFKIYLNGEETELDPAIAPSPPSTTVDVGTWYVGSDRLIGGRYFNGRIDDVAMWTRALSAAEVLELYRLGVNGWDASYLGNAPTDSDANLLPYARGLKVWLDAQDLDGKGNATLTDGEELSKWFNKAGGHAGDATAGSSASRTGVFRKASGPRQTDTLALTADELDGLQFDEFMESDTFSIFAVARVTGGTGDRPLFWDHGSSAQAALVFGASSGAWIRDGGGDMIHTTYTRPPFQQWETGLMILKKSGSTFTLEAGPADATSSAGNSAYSSTVWNGTYGAPHAGKNSGAAFSDMMEGEIAELLIFDHALSTSDRDMVLEYLDRKYYQHQGGTLIKIR